MENKTETPGAPSIALRTVAIIGLVAFALGFVVGLVAHAKFYPCVVVPTISVQRDTVRKTDTIHGKILPPIIWTTIRRDTLVLPSRPDTTGHKADTTHSDTSSAYVLPSGDISIPIERRTYATTLYRVVVSGWHPSLDSVTVYPTTTTITNTVTKLAQPPRKNWALVVGPSVGYGTTKAPIFGASIVYGFVIK